MTEDTPNPVGRPRKFASPEALQEKIDLYFNQFEHADDKKITITGLSIFLGTTRETLLDYENDDEFSDTVKRAKQRVEHSYELTLRERGNSGDIFGLKNMGWRDRVDNAMMGPDGQPLQTGIVTLMLPDNGRPERP